MVRVRKYFNTTGRQQSNHARSLQPSVHAPPFWHKYFFSPCPSRTLLSAPLETLVRSYLENLIINTKTLPYPPGLCGLCSSDCEINPDPIAQFTSCSPFLRLLPAPVRCSRVCAASLAAYTDDFILYTITSLQFSRLVASDSLRPHEYQGSISACSMHCTKVQQLE